MQTYIDQMLELIAPMFDAIYGEKNQPAKFLYIATGQKGTEPCRGSDGSYAYDDMAFWYCPEDHVVYLGQEQTWQFYQLGDAAAAVGIAHEWGHHIQRIMGVYNVLPATATAEQKRLFSIRTENQADCIAGAWLAYADNRKWIEYPDDVGDIEEVLKVIASLESDPQRDHGTLKERTDSLAKGYESGLRGCTTLIPEAPIYKD